MRNETATTTHHPTRGSEPYSTAYRQNGNLQRARLPEEAKD